MLTRAGRALLGTGLGLFVSGVAFGNHAYLLVALLPLVVLLVALRERAPAPAASRAASTLHPRRGDAVEVTLAVELPAGRGLVEIHQPLPPSFELVEGSNLHVLALGPQARRETRAFRARPLKRGRHELAPLSLETVHPLGLLAPARATAGAPLVVEVAPRLLAIGRVRLPPRVARAPFPDAARSRVGAEATDFHEVREYRWGDPPRSVNWKATARRTSRDPRERPLVNEHEREGRTAVWVFVDASTAMEVGTSLDNGLEHALEAASGVAAWHLGHGHRVGAYVYNARDAEPLFAESGRRQLLRISEELVAAAPAPPEEGLDKAVARCRPHLVRDHPRFVVVTRVGEPSRALLDGLRALRRLGGASRRRADLLVVDVRPHRLQPAKDDVERDASEVAGALDAPAQAAVRRLGATHLPWDPSQGPFAGAFLGRRVA